MSLPRVRMHRSRRGIYSVGIRAGWWNCIPSPFVQVNVGSFYASFWFELGDRRWTPSEVEGISVQERKARLGLDVPLKTREGLNEEAALDEAIQLLAVEPKWDSSAIKVVLDAAFT